MYVVQCILLSELRQSRMVKVDVGFSVLCEHRIPMKLNRKFCKITLQLSIFYWSECWAIELTRILLELKRQCWDGWVVKRWQQRQQQQLSHLSQVFGGSRLHEPKENYAGSGTWISFLHSFLSSNMPSWRPLASISCRITSIHVFFGLPCAL